MLLCARLLSRNVGFTLVSCTSTIVLAVLATERRWGSGIMKKGTKKQEEMMTAVPGLRKDIIFWDYGH